MCVVYRYELSLFLSTPEVFVKLIASNFKLVYHTIPYWKRENNALHAGTTEKMAKKDSSVHSTTKLRFHLIKAKQYTHTDKYDIRFS